MGDSISKNHWQPELEEYVHQGEPDQIGRSAAWQTAIGLQDVDGLRTSDYLLHVAKEHIEGRADIGEVQRKLESYYRQRGARQDVEAGTKEADIVSARITELLQEQTFKFSPAEWLSMHRRLFRGIIEHAGQIRPYNITKSEWVLGGDTVTYSSYESIRDTLDYDFNQEKEFPYESLNMPESVRHIAKFASGIWQIHPFCEGNTRATAVFILKYLKVFGFDVDNGVFADNSWYFRNALVRANYSDLQNGVHATTRYLELFFENLLMGANNELKNRYLHIDYVPEGSEIDSATARAHSESPKCQNGTLNGTLSCSLEEWALLKMIAANPDITQKTLAAKSGKSERTIKRKTVELQERGLIRRTNGRRNGRWEVLVAVTQG